MRFCTFQSGSRVGAGFLKGKDVVDLGIAFFKYFKRPWKFADLGDFLAQGGLAKLGELKWDRIPDDPKMRISVDFVTFLAPIVRPPKVICVGRNYPEHAKEQKAEVPTSPMLFAKAPNAVIGPGRAIEIPSASQQVDHEIELGVVIKDACDRVPKAEALDHVLGFTVVNDVSARDVQYGDKQWFRGKSFRTFCPVGPVVVTPDEIDFRNLSLRLRVNGEARQEGNTSEMMFDVPTLIEFASAAFALEPGDVIATGTPAGVGMSRTPPLFLKAGDVVEAEIEGIGVLRNTVAESSSFNAQ